MYFYSWSHRQHSILTKGLQMPVELLINATTHRKAQKGFIQTVVDQPVTWGTRETLPDYVQLVISDATKSQVDKYTDAWINVIEYSLVASNAQGRRYTLSVNPNIITEFGADKGIKLEMRDLLVNDWGATIVSFNSTTATAVVDIPNPPNDDWQALRNDLLDKFEEVVDRRRYVFSPAEVDIAIANGGRMTITTAQALARIVDRAE